MNFATKNQFQVFLYSVKRAPLVLSIGVCNPKIFLLLNLYFYFSKNKNTEGDSYFDSLRVKIEIFFLCKTATYASLDSPKGIRPMCPYFFQFETFHETILGVSCVKLKTNFACKLQVYDITNQSD